MIPKELQSDEAIRRLLSYTAPESPSDDFTARLMEKILDEPVREISWINRNQWLLFFTVAAILILLFIFPIWSLFGYEFTPGQFFMYYAGDFVSKTALWLGEQLSRFGSLGKVWYLVPVSVAIVLLAAFDQAIHKPAQANA
ncbi:MAG TPA: hypothetical protein PLJ84_01755 [Bacteroidales bacterium]|nr:hypothetical protein [Bacteroidales bacterium]HPT01293.1 hypothetical protein [Bacteroidales bacterium]